MYSTTYQHQPTGGISKVAQGATTTAGLVLLPATLTSDLLPGEGVVVHVTSQGGVVWNALYGPNDVNGGKTLSGQNASDGTLGAYNVTGNAIGGAGGVNLVSFHSVGDRIASGSSFYVYITTGGSCIITLFRIQGSPRLQDYSVVGGNLTGGNIYNLGSVTRQSGAVIRSGIGGYRRNICALQVSATATNALQNGVAAYWSLVNSGTLGASTVSQSAQKWDLVYMPFGQSYIYRQNISAYAACTNMQFVI